MIAGSTFSLHCADGHYNLQCINVHIVLGRQILKKKKKKALLYTVLFSYEITPFPFISSLVSWLLGASLQLPVIFFTETFFNPIGAALYSFFKHYSVQFFFMDFLVPFFQSPCAFNTLHGIYERFSLVYPVQHGCHLFNLFEDKPWVTLAIGKFCVLWNIQSSCIVWPCFALSL